MPTKVVFAGLSSAGKTSILLTLGKKFSLLHSVKPTIGAERTTEKRLSFLGLDIINWDLGGQDLFRAKYFTQKYRIFSETTVMFFLIDVQNSESFESALDYLKDIVKTYKDLNEKPKLVLCFHKYDPDVRNDPKIVNNLKYLQNIIPPIVAGFDTFHCLTSIFDEVSLVNAFSEGVISSSPLADLIKMQLKEYSRAINCQATVLLDNNSFIIGSYYSKKIFFNICETVAPRFFIALEQLLELPISTENVTCKLRLKEEQEVESTTSPMVVISKLLLIHNTRFCITSITNREDTGELISKFLPALGENLSNILTNLKS